MTQQTADRDTPVLDTLAVMTEFSLERSGLDPDTLILVRLAALVALDARAASYIMHVGPAVDSGVTLEQVQDVLVAVAPLVGTARTVSASIGIAEALGFVIAAAEAELEAEEAGV